MAYPLTPTRWRNVYAPGETVTWTFDGITGPTAYEVYTPHGLERAGNTGPSSLALTPPTGGWPYGWRRVYLPALGKSTTFQVIDKAGSPFFPMPTTRPYGIYDGLGNADPVLRAALGTGVGRIGVNNLFQTDTGDSAGPPNALETADYTRTSYLNPAYADPTHERHMLVSFAQVYPTRTWDHVTLLEPPRSDGEARRTSADILPLTAGDASLWIETVPGTQADTFKLRVYNTGNTTPIPGTTTPIESYDNLSVERLPGIWQAAQDAVNVSTRIRFHAGNSFLDPDPMPPTRLIRESFDRVSDLAAQFYAKGVDRFEGPWNEPQDNTRGTLVAHAFNLFAAAIYHGAPNAKAGGPGAVTINSVVSTWHDEFFANVDKTLLKFVTFHAYNTYNGDLALLRRCMNDFTAKLAANDLDGLEVWQTEQGWMFPWYGYDRARAAIHYYMMYALLLEQYGIGQERNCLWCDIETGDAINWPMAIVFGQGSSATHPNLAPLHQLGVERHGKTFTGALDFGDPGNDLFLGNRYTATDGAQSLVLMHTGVAAPTVELAVTCATELQVFDYAGNPLPGSPVPVVAGRATFPVDNTPTWVHVPAGATAVPVPWAWGPDLLIGATVTTTNTGGATDADGHPKAPASRITDGGAKNPYYRSHAYWTSDDRNTVSPDAPWQATSPISTTGTQTVTVTLDDPADNAGGLLIDSGFLWQLHTQLLDFTVAVTPDGATWHQVYAYTRDPAAAYRIGVTTSDTVWVSHAVIWDDGVWRHPINFTPQTVKAVRITVNACTDQGVEDDALAALAHNNAGVANSDYPTLQTVRLSVVENATEPPTGSARALRFGGKVLLRPTGG